MNSHIASALPTYRTPAVAHSGKALEDYPAMTQIKAPPLRALVGEWLAPLELNRLLASAPSLALQPRGQGQPVIVLPGLGASNVSTYLLRRYLTLLGYDTHGWDIGRNRGNVQQMLPAVTQQVRRVHRNSGAKVAIIGWSLGGVLAREVARDHPAWVRQVVTMGSPLVGGPRYTTFGAYYESRGIDLDAMEARIQAREQTPISVPITSIYSKRDGIVAWQASIDRHTAHAEHEEVDATHFSLGISAQVFKIVARTLAQT